MSVFGYKPDISIPAKCKDCAVQCSTATDLAELLVRKSIAEDAGESLIGEEGQRFDAELDGHLPPEMADLIKSGLRQAVGADLADVDQEIEAARAGMEANSLACSGVLRMRASKAGTTYTVSVCTSPNVYALPETHIPTHVDVAPQS